MADSFLLNIVLVNAKKLKRSIQVKSNTLNPENPYPESRIHSDNSNTLKPSNSPTLKSSHSSIPSFHSSSFKNFFGFLFYFRRLIGFYKVFYFLAVFIIWSGNYHIHIR